MHPEFVLKQEVDPALSINAVIKSPAAAFY
jgi:hypothetical protein